MSWMLTTTGAVIDLQFVGASDISVLDIAAALSKINRFTGHTSRLYSVAEHSLHVVQIMERELLITDPHALLAGLMHDAHEAYVGDMSTPLKQVLGEAWARVEDQIEQRVASRFDTWAASQRWKAEIKRADLIALALERRDLLPPAGPDWGILQGVELPLFYSLNDFEGMEPDDWRGAFLERFAELNTARHHGAHDPEAQRSAAA